MMRKFTYLIAASLALTACSSGSQTDTNPVSFKKIVEARKAAQAAKKAQKSGAPQAKLSRASIEKIDKKIAIISIPKLKYRSLATLVSDTNGFQNFYTKTEQSFIFQNGELTGTRGLRFDLMGRDLGSQNRRYHYLNAENDIAKITVNCEAAAPQGEALEIVEKTFNTTKYEEVCGYSKRRFKTRVWRDPDGTPRKAQQWIGPEHGFLIVEWLN